jgi:hypothetical protein
MSRPTKLENITIEYVPTVCRLLPRRDSCASRASRLLRINRTGPRSRRTRMLVLTLAWSRVAHERDCRSASCSRITEFPTPRRHGTATPGRRISWCTPSTRSARVRSGRFFDSRALIASLSVAVPVFYVNGEVLAQQDAVLRCAELSFLSVYAAHANRLDQIHH